jgi:hypothetical protein
VIRFAELDASTERSSYTEIAAGHETVLQAPAFVLGSFPGAATRNYFGDYRIPPVGVYEVRDCAVSSDGLLIRDGAFFTSLQLLITEKVVNECARYGELTANRIPRRVIEEPVALLSGPGNVMWGHWLIDFLPKLYVLYRFGIDIRRAKFLIASNTPQFALDLLELVGIGDTQLIRFDPYSETIFARNLIASTGVRGGNGAHPLLVDAWRFLMASIEAKNEVPENPENTQRIFLSRGVRRGRVMTNRKEIETIAGQAGFLVVVPEELSILKQIGVYRAARVIVAEYGSGLHNSIFATEGAMVCGLRANTLSPSFLQSGLCQVMRQTVSYVFGDAQEEFPRHFAIGNADFRLALRLLTLLGQTPMVMGALPQTGYS